MEQRYKAVCLFVTPKLGPPRPVQAPMSRGRDISTSPGGKRRALISNLGHVGIICDDFLKLRDFYPRVLGLTVTDEDPERGSAPPQPSHPGRPEALARGNP
jgi:hypothetical protein